MVWARGGALCPHGFFLPGTASGCYWACGAVVTSPKSWLSGTTLGCYFGREEVPRTQRRISEELRLISEDLHQQGHGAVTANRARAMRLPDLRRSVYERVDYPHDSSFRAEMQQQAKWHASDAEIVEKLFPVEVSCCGAGLEFENESSLDEEVSSVHSRELTLIADIQPSLTSKGDAASAQLDREGPCINSFEVSGAKVIVHVVERGDDLARQLAPGKVAVVTHVVHDGSLPPSDIIVPLRKTSEVSAPLTGRSSDLTPRGVRDSATRPVASRRRSNDRRNRTGARNRFGAPNPSPIRSAVIGVRSAQICAPCDTEPYRLRALSEARAARTHDRPKTCLERRVSSGPADARLSPRQGFAPIATPHGDSPTAMRCLIFNVRVSITLTSLPGPLAV